MINDERRSQVAGCIGEVILITSMHWTVARNPAHLLNSMNHEEPRTEGTALWKMLVLRVMASGFSL